MVAQIDSNYIKTRPTKLISRMISYLLFEGRPLTTRGRWINPLLFLLFAILKRIPKLKNVKSPTFILGTGRSGTTILGIVLSMHKEVGFLNEPKALWHSIYKYEDLIGSYSREKASYRLDENQATKIVIRNAQRLFSAYSTTVLSSKVVDKYPELIFRLPFVLSIFKDAKFLFLVRNGWDTCHSIQKWSQRLGVESEGESHDWWGVNNRKWYLLLTQIVVEHEDLAEHVDTMMSWTNHVDMAAVEWIVTMREGLKVSHEYPNEVLRIDYENLCDNPRNVIKDICKFTDLKPDNIFMDYAEKTLQPVSKKDRLELSPLIERAFMDTMRALGYE